MRTTIELPDSLFAKAKKLARERGVPLRELVEEGLRRVVEERPARFRLEDASFRGDGLVEGLDETDWDRIRDLAYEGRGS
ncbi:MAG: type II toxin-antitoxin system VapB family antitoxin [Myxococcota bacterium]